MIRYRLLHILLLCSLLLTLPLPVVAAPGVTSGVDLTVTVTASPGGAFPAQVTVYLALATGGGEQQKVVTPAAPTAVFTDLYRNRIYKIQAVPGQSTGAFPSAMASVLTPAFGTPEPQSLQLGDTPPISGHIMKPDLSTAAPGRVDVLNATCTQVLFSTGTSSQGYYELSLRDGAYCLRARPEDTVNYEDSAPKPVLSNAAAPQIIDLPLKARSMNTIRGRAVTDEQPPRPVKDARIVAQKLDASEAVSTTTDAEGHYSLQVPAKPATWMLSAEVDAKTSPGGLKAPLPRQVTFTTSDVITVTRDFTFTLPVAETHIVGTVLVTDTVPFVPTIPVTVTAINLITFQRASTAIDPDNGSFDLSVPGGGLYQILVVPADLLRYLPINLPQVLVSKGETKDLGTLYLIPTAVGNMATISGRVLTTEDEPVAGVRVHGLRLTDKAPALPVITREDGSFTLLVPPGTWWVAVALQEGDPYMPYRLRWQTVVTVGAHETVDDVELRVRAANATIHAVLTEGEGGNQAADACGALAAYKKGEPGVYNFGTFSHGSFDLPVIPGTYRLEVVPEPGLQENLPEDCAGGKYLPATVANLEVTASGVTTVTIPLQSSLATIHGQLWDRFQDRAVTGWGGMMFGWSPTLKTWSAARIDETTGRGDLRASPGDWLLSFRIDPASGYRPLPPALNVTVPAGQTDVDVQLPVALLNTPVQGRVLDPDGNPVQWVIVQALGVPGADTAVTDKTGAFTLALPIGAYMVEVLGPAEVLSDHDWISPAPQKLVLLPDTPAPELTLQYRRGDADIHGTLVFSSTVASGQGDRRALLTATSFGARSKTWVNMPLAPGQEYHLPALQGRDWWVAASYWDGNQLWLAGEQVRVDDADVQLDLTLVPLAETQAVQRISQAIDRAKAFYAELSDGASLYIPAGALAGPVTAQSIAQSSLRDIVHFARELLPIFTGEEWTPCCDLTDMPFDPGQFNLISPAYTLGMVDLAGNPLDTSDIVKEMILSIPYDSSAGQPHVYFLPPTGGGSPAAMAATGSAQQQSSTWTPYEKYVVDEANQKVVIFVDRWGSFALGTSTMYEELFLPLALH